MKTCFLFASIRGLRVDMHRCPMAEASQQTEGPQTVGPPLGSSLDQQLLMEQLFVHDSKWQHLFFFGLLPGLPCSVVWLLRVQGAEYLNRLRQPIVDFLASLYLRSRLLGGGPAGKGPLIRAVRAKQPDLKKAGRAVIGPITCRSRH